VQDVAKRSREKSNLLQGYGDTVLRAEALEEQLVKSRKHAAAMQSKLDAAFRQVPQRRDGVAGEGRRVGAEEQRPPHQEQRYVL
jgi:hypothetical protein